MIRRYTHLILICIGLCLTLYAKASQPVLHLDSLPGRLLLDTCWKYHSGDDKAWSTPSFDDNDWKIGSPDIIKGKSFTGWIWLRLHLKVSPLLFHKTVLLDVTQAGASEIYLDGTLIKSFGKVGDAQTEIPFDPDHLVNYIQLGGDTMQVLAVRFSANKVIKRGFNFPIFFISLDNVAEANYVAEDHSGAKYTVGIFAVFFTFSMFHLLLFLYYRKGISNLYYSILALLLSFFWLYPELVYSSHDPLFHATIHEINLFIYGLSFFLIVLLLHSIFNVKFNVFFWIIVGLTVATEITPFISFKAYMYSIVTQGISCCIKGFIIVIRAVRRKQPGAWIIAVGFILFLAVIFAVFLFIAFFSMFTHSSDISISGDLGAIVLFIWAFSIPTSMSVYLASDFARTNKFLKLQLVHVKQLSEQNIEKEREKQQLIEGQKRDLERKVKEATAEISRQKDELSEKNKEITDSINYARRIQTSILPEEEMLKDVLGEYMVLYKPKDVVSGDFYWCHAEGDKVIFAVADCTGHGVPGAFMSMIGTSLLNEIVIGRNITDANLILDELRTQLVITLQQSAQHVTTRDGMDIALCVLDKKHKNLQFAGANNSMYLISKDIAVNGSVKDSPRIRLGNEHLLEILPDKQPIGYQEDKMNNPFTKNIIQLHKGDSIFITSDGYIDQFGGTRNKKFTSKKFRELIASLVGLPLEEQKLILERTMEDWKKLEAQTDDICVMGVNVS